MAFGRRMDPVGLVQLRPGGDVLEQEGNERGIEAPGDARMDRVEGLGVVAAEIRRRAHAGNQEADVGMSRSRAFEDRGEVGLERRGGLAAKHVVGAELDDEDGDRQAQQPVESAQAARRRIARDARVDDAKVEADCIDARLDPRGIGLALGQSVARREARPEEHDRGARVDGRSGSGRLRRRSACCRRIGRRVGCRAVHRREQTEDPCTGHAQRVVSGPPRSLLRLRHCVPPPDPEAPIRNPIHRGAPESDANPPIPSPIHTMLDTPSASQPQPETAMIVARGLTQRYTRAADATAGGAARASLTVLDGVDLEIRRGEVVVILGPSGSGKTTLLGLLAGLDRPSAGDVELAGGSLAGLDEDARALLRADRIGFVFQGFHLIPTLSALENVLVPLELLPRERAPSPESAEAIARDLLAQVGLGDRLHHYPAQLSGGEQQRVGIARAFANQPQVLFADEPTGNLDRATGHEIADLLFALNARRGTTLVIVTHDLELSARAHRVVHLAAGRIARIESCA